MDFIKELLMPSFQNASNFSLAFASLAVILGYILYLIIRDHGVPPGPMGLPIVGYWPFIDNNKVPQKQLEMKKKYGDVFSFRVTGALYINLASMKVLKEAHITKNCDFGERTNQFSVLYSVFAEGVVYSRGRKWKELRTYFLTQFRDRGLSVFRENTAEVAGETILSLVDDIREQSHGPVDILTLVYNKSNLMMRNTLFGVNTTVTVEQLRKVQEKYRFVTKIMHSKNFLMHGFIGKYLVAPYQPNFTEAMRLYKEIESDFEKIIQYNIQTYDENNLRDCIDCFIYERNRRKAAGDETYKYFTDKGLVSNLSQFVGDGVVNVATYIIFLIMAVLDHPEEQEKMYEEFMEVCGEDRNPTWADRGNLKYFNAFLNEAQRTANFIPIFPCQQCMKETTVGGYRIPKGAYTVINFKAIHSDPDVYEEPEKFNPSRFLGLNGKPREPLPVVFGIGRRNCLGEGLIMIQVFIYMAAILKNFKLSYHVPKTVYEVMVDKSLMINATPRK